MSDLNDLPDVPDVPDQTGGYRAGSDDEEARKISRRVSPFGKVVAVLVLGGIAATGYYGYRQSQQDAAREAALAHGRTELEHLLSQPLPQREQARRLREIYAQNAQSNDLRMMVRNGLAGLHDPEAVPLFIEGLRGTPQERRQAALALAEIGHPAADSAREPLMQVLPQTQPLVDRTEVVWALVALQEERAWDQALVLLREGKLQDVRDLQTPPHRIFDAALVARMAGPQRLRQLATDTAIPVRRIAAVALAEIASPELYDILAVLSRDPDIDVAREAAVGLGRTGDQRAGEPIAAFITAHPDMRSTVLDALANNAGAPGLAVLLHAVTNNDVRLSAVTLLRNQHDPDSAEALQAVLAAVPMVPGGSPQTAVLDLRKQAIFGLAELGNVAAAEGLMELLDRPLVPGQPANPNQDNEAREAVDLLARIPGAAERVKPQLLALLTNERAEFMRAGIVRALATTGDQTLAPRFVTMLANADMQSGAAVALCRLGNPAGVARVAADIRRPPNVRMNEPTVRNEELFTRRRNAMQALVWTRDPRYGADLMRIIDDPQDDSRAREEAGHVLSVLADEHALEEAANRALDSARPDDVRYFYMLALRGRSSARVATQVVAAAIRPGASPTLMRAAALAAGYGGDDATAQALRPLLTSSDVTVKTNAALALMLLGDTESVPALLEAVAPGSQTYDLLNQYFVPPAAGPAGNNSTAPEQVDLIPLTEAMFDEGRIYKRVALAAALQRGGGGRRVEFMQAWLTRRLRMGWYHPLGLLPAQIRAKLREAARGTDEFRREQAFTALRMLADRGTLLWLRRQSGPSAEIARQELLRLRNAQ